jgi:hypothetical protein
MDPVGVNSTMNTGLVKLDDTVLIETMARFSSVNG